jgi:hypothetical protein
MSYDITKHKWFDDDIYQSYKEGECLALSVRAGDLKTDDIGLVIYKDDVVAMSKHFELHNKAEINFAKKLLSDINEFKSKGCNEIDIEGFIKSYIDKFEDEK